MNHPERRLLISVDMERYSRRGNVQQYEAQQAFQQLLHEAATAVGLDRVSWKTQQAGDGELAILPADAREPQVIGRLVPELNRRLRHYNSSRLPEARVRLRVALHQGLVHLDGANGFPGRAVNEVCRLCDAPQLKKALTLFPDAGVALIVSSGIYQEVVSEYPEELRPERFQRVEVHYPDKDFREFAWICVVDENLSAVAVEKVDAEPTARLGQPELDVPKHADSGAASGKAGGGPDRTGAINVGGIRVAGQNAIGHGAMAIGRVGDNASFGDEGCAQ